MFKSNRYPNLRELWSRSPNAWAQLHGSGDGYSITGNVKFYTVPNGVIVVAEIAGLPHSSQKCSNRIFGFHIHEGELCTGNAADPYSNAGGHYNPDGCPHPYHAGDLPPLFGNKGIAFSAFLTNRFTTKEIIGKTLIIHSSPDDFTSQPSGNAGTKIACGRIVG